MSDRKRDPASKPASESDTPDNNDEQVHQETPPDQGKLGDSHKHRSANSVEKGGQNEKQGEPAPGYGTVAPGKQRAGQKR